MASVDGGGEGVVLSSGTGDVVRPLAMRKVGVGLRRRCRLGQGDDGLAGWGRWGPGVAGIAAPVGGGVGRRNRTGKVGRAAALRGEGEVGRRRAEGMAGKVGRQRVDIDGEQQVEAMGGC